MRIGRLLFFFFLLCQSLQAQSPLLRQFLINSENTKLKYNVLFQDHQQLMWIGTSEGLYQYDGVDFSLYTLPGKEKDNTVTAIAADRNHQLWIGYQSGKIALLINDRLQLFNPEEGLPSRPITSITAASNGSVWFTTAGEGVYFYNRKRVYNINHDDELNDDYTYASVEDKRGNIWIGTDQGIAICRDNPKMKIIRKITRDQQLPDEIIRCLKKDAFGNIWMGTQDKGVCEYVQKENRIRIPKGFEQWNFGQINSLYINSNELWLATEKSGCINYNPSLFSGFRNYTTGENFQFPKCSDIALDREGNVWMASQAGLLRSTGNGLRQLNEIAERKLSSIHALLCAKNGNVYYTPDQQLACINGKSEVAKEQFYNITTPEKKIDISSLYEDKRGIIWIGTMGEGVFCFDPQTGQKIKLSGFDELNKASILSLAIQDEKIWITTIGGVLQGTIRYPQKGISGIAFEDLHFVKEIGNYIVYKVFIDSRNRCWFASDGQGIFCYDGTSFKIFNEKNGLNSNIILGITEDTEGNIWFSTAEAGVYRFNGKAFRNYGISVGLRENSISAILADKNGAIIMVHQKGIDVLDTKSGCLTYIGNEYNLTNINPDLNAISLDASGTIWMGTAKGIVLINTRYKSIHLQPISLIKKVNLFGNELPLISGTKLKHDKNSLVFQFASIWYSDPNRVRYRYLLEGYSKDWIVTKDNKVTFPEIPPGKYTFILQTGLGDQFKNTSESLFSFEVEAPFWEEWWFRIPAILLLLGGVYGYVKWRDTELRRYETLENEKVKFQLNTLKNQVNPHFLFNSFNTLISIIETDPETAVHYVENLSEFFRNVVASQNKDLIRLKEELEHSSAYYFLQKKRFGNSLDIQFEIEAGKEQYFLPPLVLQLLIENAVKHNVCSKEMPLSIRIQSEENTLIIRNNLNVRRTAEPSTKTGLQNIIDRYHLLGGYEIEITKTEKEFIVVLPLIAQYSA